MIATPSTVKQHAEKVALTATHHLDNTLLLATFFLRSYGLSKLHMSEKEQTGAGPLYMTTAFLGHSLQRSDRELRHVLLFVAPSAIRHDAS